ncbi:unnamed protein product, partial [Leuciscus chuanchicus]
MNVENFLFKCSTVGLGCVGLVFDLGGTYVDLGWVGLGWYFGGWDLSRIDFNPATLQPCNPTTLQPNSLSTA